MYFYVVSYGLAAESMHFCVVSYGLAAESMHFYVVSCGFAVLPGLLSSQEIHGLSNSTQKNLRIFHRHYSDHCTKMHAKCHRIYNSLRSLHKKWTRLEPLDQNWGPRKAPRGGERRTCWHGARSNEAGAAPGGATGPQADPDPATDHEMVENVVFGAGRPGPI